MIWSVFFLSRCIRPLSVLYFAMWYCWHGSLFFTVYTSKFIKYEIKYVIFIITWSQSQFKMIWTGILYIPAIIALFYWNNLLWCYFFGLLTISCFFLGCLIVIFINIALSLKHHTTATTSKTIAEMDAFHNLLMVCFILLISNFS